MEKVRVRFAPSPTGPLHIGGVRTALYDYLFAKKTQGDFILRIEDTDSARFVEGAEEYIYQALEWCGLIPDESPKHGGNYGPYRQSERRAIYDKYTQIILNSGNTYLAFDTAEELDAIRKEYEARDEVFAYNYLSRTRLKNSLTLSENEVKALLKEQIPYVVRFKMPIDRVLNLKDIIRGNFSINTNTLDDKVLVKNDGMPTYHFANIIDDFEMKITHVIRGEEWLPSMGLHVLLYEAMGWKAPEFAHLSLILKPEGKGKLSKRDGDQFGFPVFPINYTDPAGNLSKGYREEGYFPDALINFLALLGWTPTLDKEILSLEEMIQDFDLTKLHKAGARFSKDKALWFNHEYLQLKSDVTLLKEAKAMSNADVSDEKLLKIIGLMKERIHFVKEIFSEASFFFQSPTEYDAVAIKKAWNDNSPQILEELVLKLTKLNIWDATSIKDTIHQLSEERSIGMGKVMMPLRLSLVGSLKGPDVPEIVEILGKEVVNQRIYSAIKHLT